VPWVEIFAVFVVSHAAGDYLLQTDWQATNKRAGLSGDPIARRALFAHVTTYTLAFVPAGIWLADDLSPLGLVALAAGIFIPHLVQDDGRLLTGYITRVKGPGAAGTPAVYRSVDQSFHLLVLFATAIVVHAAT
jgi:Protein of unknown function (DUF3307)